MSQGTHRDELDHARRETPRRLAAWVVLAAGTGLWSTLCLRLAEDGQVPSGPTPFGDAHYWIQAGALFVLLPVAAVLARRLRPGRGPNAGAAPSGAPHPAVPLGAAASVLSGPEWLAYSAGGWGALQAVAPWSGLAALVTLFVLNVAGCGWARGHRGAALRAGLLRSVLQGLVLAPVLR